MTESTHIEGLGKQKRVTTLVGHTIGFLWPTNFLCREVSITINSTRSTSVPAQGQMGTSAEAVMTDNLGRRGGPRRKYTVEEKRAMVEETQVHGASIPEVAPAARRQRQPPIGLAAPVPTGAALG
jgi:hypothetical protein